MRDPRKLAASLGGSSEPSQCRVSTSRQSQGSDTRNGQFVDSLGIVPWAVQDNPSQPSEPPQLPGHPGEESPTLGTASCNTSGCRAGMGDLISVYSELCCCHSLKESKLALLRALDLGGSLAEGDNTSSSPWEHRNFAP